MQIQESVNAANFLSVGTSTSRKGNAEDNTPGYDFASVLNSKGGNQDKSSNSVSPEKELFPQRSKTEVKSNNSDNKSDSKVKTDKVENKKDNVTDKNDTNTKGANDSQSVSKGTDDNAAATVDGEVSEEALEVYGEVVQLIMNQFDMTLEDVEASLEGLDMDAEDLLTDEGAKAFFLDVQSVELSDVLTDENLANELQEFMSDVKNIVDDKEILSTVGSEYDSDELTGTDNQEVADDDSYIPDIDNTSKPEVTINVDDEMKNDSKDAKDSSSEKATANHNDNKTDLSNQILQNINDAVTQIDNTTVISEESVKPVNVVDQIIEQVKVNINQENTSMEMQLYPEHLGRIQIHVVSKDGVMTARIAAETETARQAIEAGLNNLKESLQNQNLKVDAIEVMVSTTGFAESDQNREQYQQQGTGKRNGRFGFSDVDDEQPEEEVETQKMQAEGSSVSYRA